MKRAITVQTELTQTRTVEDLTEVFESVASMHIARIRNHVVASQQFFAELWPTYRSLRIDPKERVASKRKVVKGSSAFVAVTSEGKLGSAADEKILDAMLQATNGSQPDIMVIGSHGLTRLQQRKIPVVSAFTLPSSDIAFTVGDIIDALEHYDQISVFYQTYRSLRSQNIERIELLNAVRELGEGVGEEGEETVSSRDYIFEPNISEIATYMESVMMGVALTQILMESKLAGYATRFNSMSRAKQRAKEMIQDMQQDYYRTKRIERDERLQEIMKVVQHGRK